MDSFHEAPNLNALHGALIIEELVQVIQEESAILKTLWAIRIAAPIVVICQHPVAHVSQRRNKPGPHI